MGSRKTDRPDELKNKEKATALEKMWKKMQKESWNNLYELHKR